MVKLWRVMAQVLVSVMILILFGCTRHTIVTLQEKGLPKKVEGASDKKIIAMQQAFNKQNIKVISIGQNYLVSIPSAYIFANQSPRLTWAGYGVLNDVVDYLKQFRKVSVYVDSYASPYMTAKREKALTLARATRVGNYLRDQGIDSRFIITEGHGSDKPIMRSKAGGDDSFNSRVEISFRRQVA